MLVLSARMAAIHFAAFYYQTHGDARRSGIARRGAAYVGM